MRIATLVGIFAATVLNLPAQNQTVLTISNLVETARSEKDPRFREDILNGIASALHGQRRMLMPENWTSFSLELETNSSQRIRELNQTLSLQFGSPKALAELKQKALDKNLPVKERVAALTPLLDFPEASPASLLRGLLDEKSMQPFAVKYLGRFDDPAIPGAVLAVYPDLSAESRHDALNTLASRATYAPSLLQGVTARTISSKEVTPDIVRQLHALKSPTLSHEVTAIWGIARDTSKDKLKEIARIKEAVTAKPPGDPAKGHLLFEQLCKQCHTLFGEGGKIGPDITGSNRKDLDYLLLNVVDPNAIIPREYLASIVELKDDRVLTGIIKTQDSTSISIATSSELITVPANEVRKIETTELSMMPEGLLSNLVEPELLNLIAYLRSNGPAR